MVFPPVPVYLDPPNWQQQTNYQQGSTSDNPQHHHQQQLPPQQLLPPAGGSGTTGSIRPGSMADRARMAKVPQPEAALKCPRCESTNTKFCYFNNYSLSQPRHFCKTCRRYWTRGGALRNVPVGGGCRRNKRSKSSSSKSPSIGDRQSGPGSTSSVPSNSSNSDILGHMQHQQPQQFPFMPSLHHLSDYGAADMGLNFGGIQSQMVAQTGGGSRSDMDFQVGGNSVGGNNILSSGGPEQWRLQQFPFLAGLEQQSSGLYPFEGDSAQHAPYGGAAGQLRARAPSSMAMQGQFTPVKMEDSNQGLNLSRQFLGIPGNDQYLGGGNAWTDLSGFTSSSAGHML
ncbi:hypothetical protein AQUCO_02700331v1 [Aquilegia coerulea]|uniref:Dof zinc finger protein n=1 Tax=Aquilegia coerulea TaxID=218851 RepID=A0A2G5D6E2_AQUCA|nr:hypothetical protein AQUCO_02700331v1 [Aquilegia coerulea]